MGIGILYAGVVEPNLVRLRTVRLDLPGFGPHPIRILHMSDIHIRSVGWRESRVAALARRASPDLIALTGDLVSSRRAVDAACRWVEDLRSLAPVYAVPGNYAYLVGGDEYLFRLASAGAVVLRNQAVPLTIHDTRFWLLGVDDPSTTRSRLEDAVEQVSGPGPRVLLAHFPTIVEQASFFGIELVLAGHTHGGQVRLPAVGAVLPFGSPLLRRYQKGTYRLGETTLYVTSGVGTTGIPVRFLCPPEVALIILEERSQ
jgi:predicted MPP superfamily phosphohydrolase